MTKQEIIVIRIGSEEKAAIKAAAEKDHLSMTTFIANAASKSAAATMKRAAPRGTHNGVPTFFSALVREAQHGGTNGYVYPGRDLASAVGTQVPNDIENDEWSDEVEVLKEALSEDDDAAVWKWFQVHYPRCMELIPTRRREQFMAGVKMANEAGDIGL